jgi:hypothetical protein
MFQTGERKGWVKVVQRKCWHPKYGKLTPKYKIYLGGYNTTILGLVPLKI